MNRLSGFQRDLLYVISGFDEPSGQDVKAELEQYYGSAINHGRLYPNLDALVSNGYVQRGQIDRRTNYYDLTEAGAALLVDRREWENRYVALASPA